MRELPGWVRWLLVGRFVGALGSMAWVFVPLYLASDRGLGEAAAGSIAAVWGVGMIVGNLAGGSVGDRWGLRPTLAGASLASAVGCLVVPATPTEPLRRGLDRRHGAGAPARRRPVRLRCEGDVARRGGSSPWPLPRPCC
ncbi:hypothetical protein P0Y31_00840 [Knoellia sp. 3-2P3]|uniref:MFS transporter n=1 Tax=unclassified Knoellia TaxID=2618719 RepID=UPI0023DB9174|nr:MFS transporter [Knoellia sp. 3-2P3]MDF2090878.1 hypothetical protein [Knoellia sp. 3-2P3]